MPPDLESPAVWLDHARSDLLAARRSAGPGVRWETPCYQAQQAAEKAIKAVLIRSGVMPPRTHYLERLLRLLPRDVGRPPDVLASVRLTQYAVETRYPGGDVSVSEDDYREALRLAQAVVDWAAEIVGA
jgi:HEPN domain-containing protein